MTAGMTPATTAAVIFLVLCAFAASGLAVLRFVRGPTDADRIVAFDILFAAAIALCGAAALYSGRLLYLDVAIGVALIGFIATLAWARVLERAANAGAQSVPNQSRRGRR